MNAHVLEPCPYCGGVPVLVYEYGSYYVKCDNYECPCKPQTYYSDDKEKVVKDWNTRKEYYNLKK